MKRRDFFGVLGGAVCGWPIATHAQQAMPVIGWLSALSERAATQHLAMFSRGLRENGFTPGSNVAIEARWADGQYDRLPTLAAELIRHPVNVILAQAPPAALAAKTATSTIPIVFVVGIDPVTAGLVASYSRPGGNATGSTLLMASLGQKRLEIVRELAPKASVVALLHNPYSPDAAPEIRDVQTAAQANRLQLRLINASNPAELDVAFAGLGAQRPDALLVGGDPFFLVQRHSIADKVARLGLPGVYAVREMVEAGGLISYGTSIPHSFRQAGIYVARILKGAKPAELPVMQPTTFELVINLKAAKTQGIEIPANLHARSDEVIE
jgi:putative tryptophan/tyrosine transport system substrate-binding protein